MDLKIVKTITITSFVLIWLLLLWIILMIATTSKIQSDWAVKDYLYFAKNGGILFFLSYLNAVLFTIVVVALLGQLYSYLKSSSPVLSIIGIVFVPVYGVLNLVAYGSQITVLPQLLADIKIAEATECEVHYVFQWIQAKPDTVIGMINGAAYAVLGVPAVCYAFALYNKIPFGKTIALLLILNAGFCLVGLTGYLTDNDILVNGVVVGGLLFAAATGFIYAAFKIERKQLRVHYEKTS